MGQTRNTVSLPKILIFSRYYIPGYRAGGPVRSVSNLVQALKDKFRIRVVCSIYDHGTVEPYENTKPNEWQNIEGVQTFYADGKIDYKSIYNEFKPDIIYFNSYFDREFSMLPRTILRNEVATLVLAPRGEFSRGALSQKKIRKSIFLLFSKWFHLHRKLFWHTASVAEKNIVQNEIHPLANQLFCINNLPEVKKTVLEELPLKDVSILKIVLPARISNMKNTLTAIRIVNRLDFPVQFDLWGLNEDSQLWNQCLEEIKKSPSHIKVAYRGELVHEKIHDVLKKYDVMFMPTLGENFGHSIVESLAAGLPVVISDQTPWVNLQASGVGYDLSLSDGQKFIDALTFYHRLPTSEFVRVRQSCLNYINQWFKNSEDVKLYEQMFKSVIKD
jgi:glycosyltransferase involved in cell wall biosynthesis